MGVMPINGLRASSHLSPGLRPSRERSVRAERSFCCCRGKPRAFNISRACWILRSTLPALGFLAIALTFLFQNHINNCLVRHSMFDVRTEPHQLLTRRIAHLPEVGGVDLRMSAEQPEVLVEERRIEI